MPSVRLAVAEFLNCEAHHLLRSLNASEIHVKMMSCPVWSIAHFFALKAFLQFLNCAALTGNCSILTRDKSFDLYISFSVNLIEPPLQSWCPCWTRWTTTTATMNPKRCWSRSWRSWQWWFLWWFQRNAWMRHMPTTWQLDQGFGIFPFGSFVVGVARLKLSGIPAQATLTMLDLKQWD